MIACHCAHTRTHAHLHTHISSQASDSLSMLSLGKFPSGMPSNEMSLMTSHQRNSTSNSSHFFGTLFHLTVHPPKDIFVQLDCVCVYSHEFYCCSKRSMENKTQKCDNEQAKQSKVSTSVVRGLGMWRRKRVAQITRNVFQATKINDKLSLCARTCVLLLPSGPIAYLQINHILRAYSSDAINLSITYTLCDTCNVYSYE